MPTPSQPLADRYPTALVTGASSGIGKAIAEALLDAGIKVYGTSRRPGGGDLNPAIHWMSFDGANPESIAEFVGNNNRLLTKLDLLINNAGSGCFGEVFSETYKQTQSQLNLLLLAPVELTKAVLPGMRERRGGAIVNISSLASSFPLPYLAAYTAGKAGLSGFTQSLMLSEGASGVTLIDFQLGDFRTNFNEAMVRGPELGDKESRVWAELERHLRSGPAPEKAAKNLVKALERGRSGLIRSGGFFQTRVAPLGIRLFPRRWLLGAIRWYYKISSR